MGKTKADPGFRRDDGYAAEIERLLGEAAGRCGADEALWRHFLEGLKPRVRRALAERWFWQAHGGQKEPPGDWTVWLLMAGRGFGKTRAGAEWVSEMARSGPLSPTALPRGGEGLRIALVGATREDVVKVMIEGPSGLIRVARLGEEVEWKPTLGTVRFPSGATAFVYSAEAPEALRGPEHHLAWADELAKWGRPSTSSGRTDRKADAAWDNLMMGLRLGRKPRVLVTTTPRPVPLLKRVRGLAATVETRGATEENVHLPQAFVGWMRDTYGGTRLGRQELGGELIEEVEGALFTREMLETSRAPSTAFGRSPPPGKLGEHFARVVVGVDPPSSTDGTCGIVVCAAGADGLFTVLADASVSRASPERWARCVAAAAESWGADRVIAEKNQGGDMVASVLRNADVGMPVKLVSASRGKVARAEPIAALFEAGRAKLSGRFPDLEDELAGLLIGGEYAGPGKSPDRADAMVWAMTALATQRREPRIVAL